ncbi:ring-infected erythrocyte surface antigen, putative [Plasmodium sp. gorilla clade G2]|uniref:ring-infected erythrocyte surface antigen, putative n=1 Tax=Plasmodium sp. gorilla clade G2 TaxID=880535 RepID=UPI000D29C419|nr:ring-infected erythrocyte surface antigen, putative [Plasmodium sp. gorilla clade G2]SOV20079.1 ring-infected erythrocyte surface antigen, putative [Plasmodium sp. gorilla clade G2]
MKPYSSFSSVFSKQYLGTQSVKAKNPTIYSFEEEKQNENISLLKILCSKRLVLPILGMLYIILNCNIGYNGSSCSGIKCTDRCSRNLYGEQLPLNPYADTENPIVVSQVFGLPTEKSTFTFEGNPDIDHTNILGFNDKLMTDVNRYKFNNNYESIPHTKEFNPLIVDKTLLDYNQRVDTIGSNGEDIIKAMQTLWDEIMDINRKKYAFLKKKLENTYSQYQSQYDMPKEKYLNLEEYRRLTVLNQIAWKALSNQIQYSCRKIINSDLSSFKHIVN